jgi:hypothetical protein
VFADRTQGLSKMSTRIALEAMWAVPAMRRSAPAAIARSRQPLAGQGAVSADKSVLKRDG